MIECWSCKTKFKITFEDQDDEVTFCPSCGQEMLEEINISEGHFDYDIDEEEWE